MRRQLQAAEELKKLHARNLLLSNTVRELRLEMGYYKGETRRLELEKRILTQEASHARCALLAIAHHPQQAKILQDPDYLNSLVQFPSRSISEVLQTKDTPLLLTTSQAPFFLEFANKGWAETCGWEAHDVMGLTTAFLQGPLTDLAMTSSFMTDIQEFGYGHMRIINYRRSGEMYVCTVKVFPVFDTVRAEGPDCDVPVRPLLTRFCC